jgi:eukaryotic-like serine/threonine-protein kinase
MSDVWSALDQVLDRRVAVKILRPALTDDLDALARFRREARLAARVNHTNVVAVYDTVSGDGCDAMVQELIEGRTLRDVLDEHPKLAIAETVRVGTAVADALAGAHTVGLVHRAVQPDNVLLADDGRVLLTDFGIATRHHQDLTGDDLAMGAAAYLSPEQVEGEPVSERADLYALGVVLYECLAGRAPFAPGPDAAVLAIGRGDPIPLRTLRPAIPSRLATLVRACLARTPADRPRSAAFVRDALRALAPQVREDHAAEADTTSPPSSLAGQATPSRAEPLERRRWPLLVTASIVASVVGAFGLNVVAGRRVGDIGQPPPDAADAATPIVTVYFPPLPAPTTTSIAPAADAAATSASTPVAIVSVGEFDPPPGDGRESPAKLGNLADGNVRTLWSSLCYDEVGLGPKDGIGLVFELSGSAAGHSLEVTSPTRSWSAAVFVSDERPSSVPAWGRAVSTRQGIVDTTTEFPLEDASGRFVLLWITRLGTSPVCKLPYDIRIAEVGLS